MTKLEFLSDLVRRLEGREDRSSIVQYYREMIDDRIDDGMTEEEAVAAIGNIDEICAEYKVSVKTASNANMSPASDSKKKRNGWVTAAIVAGSPLWIILLVAAVIVSFALLFSLWAVVISLWAVVVSLGFTGVVAVISCGFMFSKGIAHCLLLIGIGITFIGLTIFCGMGMVAFTQSAVKVTSLVFKRTFSAFKKRRINRCARADG